MGKPKDTTVHKTRDVKAEENFLKFTSASNKSDLDSQFQVNGHAAPAGGRKIEEVLPAAKVEKLKGRLMTCIECIRQSWIHLNLDYYKTRFVLFNSHE